MTTLYELTGEALQIQRQIDQAAELLFSDDPNEVAAATATLEALISAEADTRQSVLKKADAWCWVIDHLRAQAIARKARAQSLAELSKTSEQQADALQDRLIAALGKIDPDATKWELPEHKITSRASESVDLDPDLQPADLPEQFCRAKTTYTADKVAIKAALKAGTTIEGAQLIQSRNWSIK